MNRSDLAVYLANISDSHRLNTIENVFPEFLAEFSREPEFAVKRLIQLGHKTGLILQPINYVSWVRCMARWAFKHGLLPYLPDIPLPKRTPVFMDAAPLSDAQIRMLMEYVSHRSLVEKALLACLLNRGLRRNEALSIRHQDIGNGWLAIKPKGHKVHVKIPCDEKILAILRALRDAAIKAQPNCRPESYLLCPPRMIDGYGDYEVIPAMSDSGIALMVSQWGEVIGRELTPHKFRHACATVLIEAGLSARQVSVYLRQELEETQRLYFDRKGKMAEEAFDAMPSWMTPSLAVEVPA